MKEIFLKTIDSTNTYAKLHATQFDPHQLTCIVAEEQTAGRGRFDRTWVSPPGVNLYVTFFFHLPSHQLHLPALGLICACSMATVIQAQGLHPHIKWPNDLQLNGKKLGGILCEMSTERDGFNVFAGFGLNVNMEAQSLEHVGQPATSFKAETGRSWDRKLLLQKLQTQFAHDLVQFRTSGFAPFRERCESFLAYKGKTIRCVDGTHEWIGICKSLADDGRLILELPNGQHQTLSSGEVSLRVH